MNKIIEGLNDIQSSVGDGVTVLPVTKYVGVDRMRVLLEGGVKLIGENRVQDAVSKFDELGALGFGKGSFQRHLIGHLQSNKVKKAIENFDVIQSVDSVKIAKEISKWSEKLGVVMDICLQVNVVDDPDKFGFSGAEVREVVEDILLLPSLRLVGLMMIGKLEASVDETRESFQRMKKIYDEFLENGYFQIENPILSMGMSGDYKIAAECGATMVRVGGALFKSS